MIYRDKNYSRGDIAHAVAGDEFIDCNLSQLVPGTVVSVEKNLKFTGCNLVNVALDSTWLYPDCNTFQGLLEIEPETQPNESLASLAIAAKAILDKSPKLQSPEIQGLLDQLVIGVKSVANANPADGDAATAIVNKMLDDPQLQAQPELWEAIKHARDSVIAKSGGAL